jgi:hypothetical protein
MHAIAVLARGVDAFGAQVCMSSQAVCPFHSHSNNLSRIPFYHPARTGAGTKPGDGLARELEAARHAARDDERMTRARHLQKESSAEKRAVKVEDAYSMPNGDSRSSARGGGAWANKLSKVAQ